MSTRVVRAVLVTPLLLAVLGGCVYCSSGSAAGASGDLCGSFGSRRLSRGTRAALRWRRRHPLLLGVDPERHDAADPADTAARWL